MIENKLKTKRAKKIALNYKHEKAFRNLLKQHDKVYQEEKDAEILVPLDKPIFWKYCMSLGLREDFAQSKEADFWQSILDNINSATYGKSKKELLRINLKPFRLDSKEFSKLTFKQKRYFRKCIKPYEYTFIEGNGRYYRKKVTVSYKFTKPYIFKPKFEKLYLTHYVERIVQNRKEGYISSECIMQQIERQYWGRLNANIHGSGTSYRKQLNRNFRTKSKYEIRLMMIKNQTEEEANIPQWRRNFRYGWW